VTANGSNLADKTDGRALPIDPGIYQLRFEAPGFVPIEQSISVRQSEKNRIVRVHLQRDPASVRKPVVVLDAASLGDANDPQRDQAPRHKPIPAASYILGGVTVVGLGVFTYFGLSELSEVKEKERFDAANAQRVQNGTAAPECGSLCDRGRRDFILTYVGLGVAVASAAGAIIAYAVSDPGPVQSAAQLRFSVAPVAASRGALVQLTGAF
jgi:hypothetical protein